MPMIKGFGKKSSKKAGAPNPPKKPAKAPGNIKGLPKIKKG